MNKIGLLSSVILACLCVGRVSASGWSDLLKDENAYWLSPETDTIPITDRDGDFTTQDFDNPFDIYPSDVEQAIEYDPASDTYIITEKIGDEYFRMPSFMTFEEYLEYKSKEEEKNYFGKLSGFGSDDRGKSGLIDPMSRLNIKDKLTDRLFGGTDINIKPQGNIDITLGTSYQFVNNGIFPGRKIDRWQIPLFEQNIKMNVDGNIGKKMDLGFNYDTQATFDFDRKINLVYDADEFSEDDIIRKIEAGNVKLPLRSSLIQGSQELFGLKTELQFGNLTLTAVAAQQRSKPKKLSVQNGATVQEFEIKPTEYDENRHFFISHYHRNAYEDALSKMPHILSSFTIANLEVWISDDRLDYNENSTQIVMINDLGEPYNIYENDTLFSKLDADYFIDDMFFDPLLRDVKGVRLPSNKSNDLYRRLVEDNSETRENKNVTQNLKTLSDYELTETRDFEKFKGRMLNPSEYTFNPELGFISLNIRLQPSQQLGVSYEYFYTQNCDEVYQVGELVTDSQISSTDSTGLAQSESVVYVKMLKNSTQSINHPTWDLMMKNVYALRTNNLTQEDFVLDIFFEDDRNKGELTKYISEPGYDRVPLLNLFNLDRLNSVSDPQPDGVFDFVPGVTVIPRNGAILFPVLEPFGSAITSYEADDQTTYTLPDSLIFEELYTEAKVIAETDYLDKNKFIIKGQYKSNTSSEISLGSWNIPKGSVRVRAGGRELIEGVDYEVEYGRGLLRILNEAYLQQGVPLDISLEDSSFFSLQQKDMLGLRADYEVSKDLRLGGTILKLKERPFTQKVNIGDDPINNTIYGLDLNYEKEAPWLTKALDALPIYSTNAESRISVSAEGALLKPGHNRRINLSDEEKDPVVNIDDFEGAVTGLPLGTQPFAWQLASIPNTSDFPEYNEIGVETGVNRASMTWYIADINARTPDDADNPYSRGVLQTELFENRQIPTQLQRDLYTFDIAYDPTLRGPYNFDEPDGTAHSAGFERYDNELGLILSEPEKRWAGIMRYLNTNDFQAANYEFIDFWMLDPFLDQVGYDGQIDSSNTMAESGVISFHLGNVSEDILKDGVQCYENAISVTANSVRVDETEFGNIPDNVPVTGSFDIDTKEEQDLGLDAMDRSAELTKHEEWLNRVNQAFNNNIPIVEDDPSGDDFYYFGDTRFDNNENLVNKYRFFSNSENNSPDIQNNNISLNSGVNSNVRGKFQPDSEELNGNSSLNESENFYKYDINIVKDQQTGRLDTIATDYITDQVTVSDRDETWYRFRIPIQDENVLEKVGDIDGFRSIQFMRMITRGFSSRKIFRMAEFELVRSQWRKARGVCDRGDIDGPNTDTQTSFNLDIRGIEENSKKTPFGYLLPPDIKREEVYNSINSTLLDERALSMNFDNFESGCRVAMNKVLELDLRLFKRLQMFVHAEELPTSPDIENGDLELFVKLGKDFDDNYYEYSIPLVMSEEGVYGPDVDSTDQNVVWRPENKLDITLDSLTKLKRDRDNMSEPRDVLFDRVTNDFQHRIGVIGTPSLGAIKAIQIGVRNVRPVGDMVNYPNVGGEVWVNELRAVGFDERGGLAALAQVDVQLADLGNLTLSGNYNSIGWGSIDQRLNDRSKEENISYDIATSLQLGKFLPSNWGVRVPFYAQYAKTISNPQFHPFDSDITMEEKLADAANATERAQIKRESQDVTTIKTYNFTNVKKERKVNSGTATSKPKKGQRSDKTVDGGAVSNADLDKAAQEKAKLKEKRRNTPKPWDISNFSVSYGYTETDIRDPLLEYDNTKQYRGALDYTYSRKVNYIEPFKKLKSKHLDIIKEFNFNLLPNSFSFNTTLDKKYKRRKFRLPNVPVFEFDEKNFSFERRYDLKWDFTKSLSLKFNAVNSSFIDELRQVGIADTAEARSWEDEEGKSAAENGINYTNEVNNNPDYVTEYWKNNLWDGGRDKNYGHQINLNYTLPIRYLPFMDWIKMTAQYKASYDWAASPLIVIDQVGPEPGVGNQPGSVIQNSQDRSLNATFSFDKLYNKSKYVKKLDGKGSSSSRSSRGGSRGGIKREGAETADAKNTPEDRKKKSDKSKVSTIEKLLVRPLFSLRTVKFSLRESFSTLIPGFGGNVGDGESFNPRFLGLTDGFDAPGWDFVAGIQPNIQKSAGNDNWLYQNQEWWNESLVLNKQIMQKRSLDINLDVELEPWKDVDIDVEFYKRTSLDHSEEFTFLDKTASDPDFNRGFYQQALYDVGSVEFSYFTMNTLFGDRRQKSIDLFNTMRTNRATISQRLGTANGVTGAHEIDGEEYVSGFGKLNNDVVVPAFIAAYTDQDANTIGLDILGDVQKNSFLPRPNWSLRYNGLSKLSWFKDWVKSFTLKHGYKSVFTINRFNSDPQNEKLGLESGDPQLKAASQNYYTRWEIPSIQISEQFNPIIGFDIQTKSNVQVNFEYKKSRLLDLFTTVGELREQKSTEFVFGFGFEMEDVNIGFLTGDRKGKKKRKSSTNRSSRQGGLGTILDNGDSAQIPRSLIFDLSLSWADNITYAHDLKNDAIDPQAVRGTTQFRISPSIEYDINKNLSLRWYGEYGQTTPHVTPPFPVTNFETAFVVRFKLN